MPSSSDAPAAIIVGAGLAGLAAARELAAHGQTCLVLEASDGIGGRARTDVVDGFLLDRGFQVLLTAYPEARRVLDFATLELRTFDPGSLVFLEKVASSATSRTSSPAKLHLLADPWRMKDRMAEIAFSSALPMGDKLRIRTLRERLQATNVEEILAAPEHTTAERLATLGFSPAAIQQFFGPFYRGIFLERELATSSRMLEFVFKMFSEGDAALPARGTGAMASQLAAQIAPGAIHLNTPVQHVEPSGVRLADGTILTAPSVIVAADQPHAARLLGDAAHYGGPTGQLQRATTCLYFATSQAPLLDRMLVLNGSGTGLVNNMCVVSQIQPTYSPAGQHLISVSLVGVSAQDEAALAATVLEELCGWFGEGVRDWRYLRSYVIPFCLPDQSPEAGGVAARDPRLAKGLYICGDYCDTASINGALLSGRRAAEAALADLP